LLPFCLGAILPVKEETDRSNDTIIRIIKYFVSPAVLFGYAGWAVNTGLTATGALTPFWGWVLTITGIVALLFAIALVPKGIRGLKAENRAIKLRQKIIVRLRKVLETLEGRIDTIRTKVEKVPLSYYETHYLSSLPGYADFKRKYSNEADAQYVALIANYFETNPLFRDEYNKDKIADNCSKELKELKSQVPDTRLDASLDGYLKLKQLQAVLLLSHRLDPSKLSSSETYISSAFDTREKIDKLVRDTKRGLNKLLNKLWAGAKYE